MVNTKYELNTNYVTGSWEVFPLDIYPLQF